MYPGVGTFVLIRPTQTFYERIKLAADDIGVYRFSHDEEAGTEVEEVKVWQGGTVLDRGLRSLFKGPEEFSGYESFLLGLHESELLASTPQS